MSPPDESRYVYYNCLPDQHQGYMVIHDPSAQYCRGAQFATVDFEYSLGYHVHATWGRADKRARQEMTEYECVWPEGMIVRYIRGIVYIVKDGQLVDYLYWLTDA